MPLTQREFDVLFRAAPEPVVVVDVRLALVAANDAFLRATGTTRDILGRGLAEVFPDDSATPDASGPPCFVASIAHVAATGAPHRVPVARRDGPRPGAEAGGVEARYWSASSYPVLDDEGRVAFVVQEVRDVGHERQADDDHQASRILEGITDAFFSLDRRWRFTYLNAQSEAKLLRARSELLGKVLWEEFPAALGTTFESEYRRAMADRCAVTFEEYYPAPLDRWYEVNASPTAEGLAVYFRDVTERRAAQELLRASEQRFRALVMATSDVVYRMNADWSEMAQLVGRDFVADTREPSRTWLDTYIAPEDRERVVAAIGEAVRTRSPFELEHRVVRADGTPGWTFSRAVPILDAQGEVVEWFGTASDVTRRKEAEGEHTRIEQASERQRRIYEAALSNTPDLVYIFDLEHRFLYANEALLAMWGRTREESLGKNCLELGYEPWHAAMHDREIDQVVATRRPIRGEVPFTGTNGRRIYDYIFVPVLGADGSVVAVAGTTRDVTERQAAEAALRDSELRFRLLADGAPVAIGMSRRGETLYVNPAYRRCFGIAPDEPVEGRSIFDEIAPEEHERVRELVRARYAGDAAAASYEFKGLRRDGSRFPVQVEVGQIELPDGPASLAFLIDLTERRRAEREIRRSEAKFRVLATIDAETRPLTDPDRVTAVTARLLAEHLGADRCAYAEIEEQSVIVVTGDHNRGVASIVGRWPIAAFGEACARSMLANEPFIAADTDADPRLGPDDLTAYRTTDIRAVICVPLHKDGTLTAAMAVQQKTPRRWTDDEVELVRLVVSRCWESLERARVTRSLEQSEERFRLFMEHSPASAWIADADGRIEYLSPAYHRMFRLPQESVVGRSVFEIYPRPLAEQYVANMRLVVEGGRAIEVIEDGLLPDGGSGKFLVFKFPLPVQDGRNLVGGVAVDITDRMVAERRLSESEERYRTLAENVQQLFWTCLPDGRCDYLSNQWIRYTGIPAEEQLGMAWLSMVVHPDDRERTLRVWMDAVGDRGPYDVNYRIRAADGAYRWFKTRGTPIRGASGAIVRWFGTCTDIDAQVRAEEALREADRRKDEFLAMLAHELRNPLSAIGNAVQLSRRSGSGDYQEWSREVIEKHVGSLSRMIDDLLDVSRITRGKIDLRRQPLEVPAVMAHAVETVRPLVQERRHELTVSHASTSPLWADADPHRIEQVIVNLLINAARYTDPGGKIALSARPEGDSIAIVVADNGRGIPPGKIADMFELFTQGDRSIARSEGGLGIGLTIVKSLVEMHGGSVVARSEGPGKGCEFTVRIPAIPPPPPAQADRAPARPAAARTRARVLVVDDNRDSAVGLARLLRVLGNDVELAHDGPTAIHAAHRQRPDYVLLDIGLPGMDGYEVAQTLRAEGFRDAVIIAISGYGEEAARRRSREAGFDHHLVKPVDYDRLVAILQAVS